MAEAGCGKGAARHTTYLAHLVGVTGKESFFGTAQMFPPTILNRTVMTLTFRRIFVVNQFRKYNVVFVRARTYMYKLSSITNAWRYLVLNTDERLKRYFTYTSGGSMSRIRCARLRMLQLRLL